MDIRNLKDEILSVRKETGYVGVYGSDKPKEYPITITKKFSRIFIKISKDSIQITFRRTNVFEYPETGNTQNQHSKGLAKFDISHLDIEVFNLLKSKLESTFSLKETLGICDVFSNATEYGGKGNFEKSKRYINALLRIE